MKTYGQYCPIATAAEIFAERWTPLVVRNLLTGCDSFGAILAGAPGMPRSLLSQRLRALERKGIVERRSAGRRVTYHLTECGRELADVCYALGVWGTRWLEHTPSDFDAYLALWYFTRLVNRDALPPQDHAVGGERREDLPGDGRKVDPGLVERVGIGAALLQPHRGRSQEPGGRDGERGPPAHPQRVHQGLGEAVRPGRRWAVDTDPQVPVRLAVDQEIRESGGERVGGDGGEPHRSIVPGLHRSGDNGVAGSLIS